MMNIRHSYLSIFYIFILFYVPFAYGEYYCRPYEVIDEASGELKYGNGLLWKISLDGVSAGYIFGTIHIGDEEVLNLPEPVLDSLASSNTFIMEVIPEPEDAQVMSMSMFFMDGKKLDDVINNNIFHKTAGILAEYGFTRDMVSVMKPWAAYIIMSYPENASEILDLKLLNLARSQGLKVFGLETAMEQVDIFARLSLDDQSRMLTDTVCHYEETKSDFDKIREFYLDGDLKGLYEYSQRYSFDDDAVYERIAEKLITIRNGKMVERIMDHFKSGITFVAVGAMHLPGDDGILNLLELNQYQVDRIY